MPEPRRFPIPWTIEEGPACFIVQDAAGARIAYCYFLTRDRLAHDADKLDRIEALKIARNILKLPSLLQQQREKHSEKLPKGSDAALARVAR